MCGNVSSPYWKSSFPSGETIQSDPKEALWRSKDGPASRILLTSWLNASKTQIIDFFSATSRNIRLVLLS